MMTKKPVVPKPVRRDKKGNKIGKKIAPQGTGMKPPIQEDDPRWNWGTMGNKRGPSRIILQKGKKGKRNK
jgi:hypothetical protein